MKKFVSHENEGELTRAIALRRYLSARAAGRRHPEYVVPIAFDGIAAWVGCTEIEAKSCGGKFRHLRQSGRWCEWLGRDTRIQDDHALSAYLELAVSNDPREESHDWSRMLKEVTKNRVKALREWRTKGVDILRRYQHRQSQASTIAVSAKAHVSDRYRRRGLGHRPLKSTPA